MIPTSGKTFSGIVDGIVNFIDNSVIPLLFSLAFLFFLIGMARFFFSQNEESREKGRQFAIWGMVGLVVMFGVWGIVNLFVNALNSGG